jgi:predicted nucleic acid-binding Zn ribbon protein
MMCLYCGKKIEKNERFCSEECEKKLLEEAGI